MIMRQTTAALFLLLTIGGCGDPLEKFSSFVGEYEGAFVGGESASIRVSTSQNGETLNANMNGVVLTVELSSVNDVSATYQADVVNIVGGVDPTPENLIRYTSRVPGLWNPAQGPEWDHATVTFVLSEETLVMQASFDQDANEVAALEFGGTRQ